jgi:hypothetical protein
LASGDYSKCWNRIVKKKPKIYLRVVGDRFQEDVGGTVSELAKRVSCGFSLSLEHRLPLKGQARGFSRRVF